MNQLPPRNVKFGEKTDVWGIGNIAYKLIMNGLVDQGPIRCDTSTKDDLFEEFDGKMPLAADYWRNAYPNDDGNVFRPGCKACRPAEEYQPDLKQLVRRCLNYEQDERPSLMEIIAEVDQHFSEFPEHMDELMDKGRYNFRVPDLDQLSTGEAMDVDT
jgi:serine/threonine protein kinase